MVNPEIQDKRCYWQVRPGPGDSWATCETREGALEFVGAADDDRSYEIRETWMTPNQFAKLREFAGW